MDLEAAVVLETPDFQQNEYEAACRREMEAIWSALSRSHADADRALIDQAFATAELYHRPQRRTSGEPYIFHPLAVARIVAELGMTSSVVAAALLHDTVEDTAYTLDQVEADFSADIANMVDGVTKLDKSLYGDMAKAETIRKIIVSMFHDLRVIVIKLADRLHNMRTIESLRHEKRNRIAKETLDIYAPLAHRLGVNTIKWELEDLSFSTLQPKIYQQLVQQVASEQPAREANLQEIIPVVVAALHERGITAQVTGRPKHYYSIYQKMVVRGRDFTDIYDLLGIRIILEPPDPLDTNSCYMALATVHALWLPMPGRFKDYIVNPKFSTYQSLHTTVIGPHGKPIEFQIRTREMHHNAEYGVAAHWRYKARGKDGKRSNQPDPMEMLWVKRLSQWQAEEDDPSVFLDNLTADLRSQEVMVFSPKSEPYFLPVGSTPVDYAYVVHTEVGHRCIGARINGRLTRLDTPLVDGDVCEILTTKVADAGPSRDWLEFVKSPRARQKISQFFSKERRDIAADAGKDAIAKQLRHAGLALQRILTLPYLTAVADKLHLADITSLYVAVGNHRVGAQKVVELLIALEGGAETAAEESYEDRLMPEQGHSSHETATSHSGVLVAGDGDVMVKLARCCTPVPGDDIIGFVTRSSGVSVHRRDCRNVADLLTTPDRIVPVTWAKAPAASYLVTLKVEGLDRVGLLADVSAALSEGKVSIVSAQVHVGKDRTWQMTMSFDIPDPHFLESVIRRVRTVPEVTAVHRVNA
ncbi:MAG: bifunctional (p)ppGpp synthetase/guanosine-3',5'-bis(diphosphate) 3'-pyrophosphohydrolase [Propionibacteriaceae bacterium]|jgi:GTP pyrophosphokinase|nr:bifunctional (p)ppGpp synthetase/guanosine-3',5'-bis(diphosphate) 3'-pyrophosphohydrolase [Propionibacteriaceae bacterium]